MWSVVGEFCSEVRSIFLYSICSILCLHGDNVSAAHEGGSSTPLTETLGSSSNQSAIRQRLLWATEDTDYPRVTGGIFSICALVPRWLACRPGATERELVQGSVIGRQDELDLAEAANSDWLTGTLL